MRATSDKKIAEPEDWRRNPWVWLIIAIPSLTVIGCALTMYLAISHPHIMIDGYATQSSSTDGSQDSGSK
jgi:hypothetical protein